VPDLDTILIAVGGGGLLAGSLAALEGTSTRVVAVEPMTARCLGAAQEAGEPVDVPVSGPAVDSLGVRRVGTLAFNAAAAHSVQHVDVTNEAIVHAQLRAWEELRIGLEAGGATALAALLSSAYRPAEREMVGVLCCGGNVDIAALLDPAT
jgi:threonine dehydratase